MSPIVYVIAGPNGAGKTTFARTFLREYTPDTRFINADIIARSLSEHDPNKVDIRAGRIMLNEIRGRANHRIDFAFESTLSGLSHLASLRQLRGMGYFLAIICLWLPSVDLALSRVAKRVEAGGHPVQSDIVPRRFDRSITRFLREYRLLADSWFLLDNSTQPPRTIALREGTKTRIIDNALYNSIVRAWYEK